MRYDLPKAIEIDGVSYPIRYDYRVILDIFDAMNDPDLNDEERSIAVLQMFYPDFEEITDYNKAIKECIKFINGGQDEKKDGKQPRLISWEQDFPYIVAPVNRVLGQEIRGIEYDVETNTGGLHWWTFLSAYFEIGDCLFAQIVRIRDKKARGKKLEKSEQEFYRKNRDLIDVKVHYSESENDLVKMWTGG